MKLKTLALGAAAVALMAIPSIAEASWAQTSSTVNLRSGPGVNFAVQQALGAGTPLWILDQRPGSYVNGFYHVALGSPNGPQGFVSAKYVEKQYASNAPMGPAPRFGYAQRPWWDNTHHAWYDGHRWYRNGIWYNSPSGLSFGFSFGG